MHGLRQERAEPIERFGDVLAQRGQTAPAAGRASAGRRLDYALSWQMRGQRLSGRPLARVARHRRLHGRGDLGGEIILAGLGLQLLQLQLALVDQTLGALRTGSEQLSLELGDPQLQMGDLSLVLGNGVSGISTPGTPELIS